MSSFEQFDNVVISFGLSQTVETFSCYLKIVDGIIFLGDYKNVDYTISSFEISSISRVGDFTLCDTLKIKTKYFLCITIYFENNKDATRAYDTIFATLTNSSYSGAVAFFTTATSKYPFIQKFNISQEYERMGVPNLHWRISHTLNEGFKLCSTYPDVLVVPTKISDSAIIESSSFRSRQRIPALSFYHKISGASLCRSSQPMVGLNNRNESDELLIKIIGESSDLDRPLLVVDTRPKINALANRAGGKGYELKQFYPNIEFIFRAIENIHVMRNSLAKLMDVIEQNGLVIEALVSSSWLSHLHAIIECSVLIAQRISEGGNVLAHCSDGWDRTSQICALSSLLLDPFHRTIEGFWVLIEREWLSFGHQFCTRCGHLNSGDPKFVSPIFVQFMDCVWQIFLQFPSLFEFDDRLLIFIIQQSFTCNFGEFLYNSVNERTSSNLFSMAVPSIYYYIYGNKDKYLNKAYDHEENMNYSPFIKPISDPRFLQCWTQLYVNGGRLSKGQVLLQEHFSTILENEAALTLEKENLIESIRDLVEVAGRENARSLVGDLWDDVLLEL